MQPSTKQPGADFSVSLLLSPLPAEALPSLLRLASCIPATLAGPILQQLAQQQFQLQLSSQAASNVIWKLEHYLPEVFVSPHTFADLPPVLKALQQLEPRATLVDIANRRETCPFCTNAPKLQLRQKSDRATVPCNLPGRARVEEHRFRFYSFAAGVQYAFFQEASCGSCRRFFLADWCFSKAQAHFGHMSDVQYMWQAPVHPDMVVIPKYRSYFAVEVALLRHITDTLHFAAGSLRSAVLLWGRRHTETIQHDLIFGADHTLLPHVEEDLLMAWYTWNIMALTAGHPRQCSWKFNAEFDDCLLQHMSIVRALHMDRVAAHVQNCPQCGQRPVTVLDGKYGARRMICAGLDGAQHFEDLGVVFDTGCINFAPPGRFHCGKCARHSDVTALIRGQLKVTGMECLESAGLSTCSVLDGFPRTSQAYPAAYPHRACFPVHVCLART